MTSSAAVFRTLDDAVVLAEHASAIISGPRGIELARSLLDRVRVQLGDVAGDPDLPGEMFAFIVGVRDDIGAYLRAADGLSDAGTPEAARRVLRRCAARASALAFAGFARA